MANLITNGVEFLVSNAAANNLQYTELNWPNENYKQLMLKRFKQAGADVSDL